MNKLILKKFQTLALHSTAQFLTIRNDKIIDYFGFVHDNLPSDIEKKLIWCRNNNFLKYENENENEYITRTSKVFGYEFDANWYV